ncbi:MAG: serine/threonine protein kinase [Methylococcales bacterium]|jgi:serine/threonine protein kinase|nr:serine/threonine protein kinase [Methylococcales bacterium]MBT7445551.1 serine/threonine protein kinase [Methylococcales bacterium]
MIKLLEEVSCDVALARATVINQYRVLGVLGQGAFGITYLGLDMTTDKKVAIKEFLPELLSYRSTSNMVRPKTYSELSTFEHFKQRFLEEAQNLARFKHHNIVRINDYFEANDTAYMVMEYENGSSLDEKIIKGAAFSESEVTALLHQLMNGLRRLHQVNIIHRDIKPGNIYIRERDGSAVLLDFGSARQALYQKSQNLTTLLTVGYSPIEQYSAGGTHQGPWSDIYALSAVGYELLTGNRPMESTIRSEMKMRTGVDPMPSAYQSCSSRFSPIFLRIIDCGLEILADDRPQSVDEWQKRFEGLQSRTEIKDIEHLKMSLNAQSPDYPFHSLGRDTNSRTVVPVIEKAAPSIYQSKSLDFEEVYEKPAGGMSFATLVVIFLLGVTAPLAFNVLLSELHKDFFVWGLIGFSLAMFAYFVVGKALLPRVAKYCGVVLFLIIGVLLLLNFPSYCNGCF